MADPLSPPGMIGFTVFFVLVEGVEDVGFVVVLGVEVEVDGFRVVVEGFVVVVETAPVPEVAVVVEDVVEDVVLLVVAVAFFAVVF